MKKTIIAIFAMLVAIYAASAQESFRFMGIDVDGPFYDCAHSLRKAGFRPVRGEVNVFNGKYRGTPVTLQVETDAENRVSMFVVSYPLRPGPNATASLYDTVRMMLIQEYGTPSLSSGEYGDGPAVTSFSIYPGGTTDDGSSPLLRKKTVEAIGEITLSVSGEDDRVRIFVRKIQREEATELP